MGANRRRTWRQELGDRGEEAALQALTARHWDVENLNRPKNFPNADLAATKHGLTLFIQVKAYNDYRWVSGGGVCCGAKASSTRHFLQVLLPLAKVMWIYLHR